ncbi:MAG: hypothetical protein IT306_30735 [Chloroflexi bacterium]|nr:hypothetical protein [Chloroflexota bacterium]
MSSEDRPPRSRRIQPLWTMLLLAVLYGILLDEVGSLSASVLVDGLIGVLLGLFICSAPASAAVDLLYLDRHGWSRLGSDWADLAWVGLNLLVMIVGCFVTIVGAVRFVG